MYIGHLFLITALFFVYVIAWLLSKKKPQIFSYTSFLISAIFLILSGFYFYDIFLDTKSDNVKLSWITYLLTQNEDFFMRKGAFFGLYWGFGISVFALLVGAVSLYYIKNRISIKKTEF